MTAVIEPPDSSRARTAPFHDAGLPMRIAVATVCGSATTSPVTIGAAPAAWNPCIFGRRLAIFASRASVKPFQ